MSEKNQLSLHTIVLLQKDLQKAVAFYQRLGLECALYKTGQWAEFKLGSARLALCPAEEMQDKHTGLVFATKEFLSLVKALKDEGFSITNPIETNQGTVATVTDPGGNQIDIMYPEVKIKPCPKGDSCCSA